MTNEERKKLIAKLEDENSELAMEILLNDVAISDAEKEIKNIDSDIVEHPEIKQKVEILNSLIETLRMSNQDNKLKIFKNNFDINLLNSHE